MHRMILKESEISKKLKLHKEEKVDQRIAKRLENEGKT